MPTNPLTPINLRLPKNLISESDELAALDGSTRSEIMRSALRLYLEKRRKLQMAYDIVERRGKMAGINTEADIDKAIAEVRAKVKQTK